MIDIDRLHTVAYNTSIERGAGNTYFGITLLASAVALNEPILYCVLSDRDNIWLLKDTIIDVFKEYELPTIEWIGRLNFKCANTTVFFAFCKSVQHAEFIIQGLPKVVSVISLYDEYTKRQLERIQEILVPPEFFINK